jgi:hypothetical protein
VTKNQFARWTGVVVLSLNAIAQLLMIPAYPLWSLAIFAIDILAVYGLVAYGKRIAGSCPTEVGSVNSEARCERPCSSVEEHGREPAITGVRRLATVCSEGDARTSPGEPPGSR